MALAETWAPPVLSDQQRRLMAEMEDEVSLSLSHLSIPELSDSMYIRVSTLYRLRRKKRTLTSSHSSRLRWMLTTPVLLPLSPPPLPLLPLPNLSG